MVQNLPQEVAIQLIKKYSVLIKQNGHHCHHVSLTLYCILFLSTQWVKSF
jgi:hypothetical protein